METVEMCSTSRLSARFDLSSSHNLRWFPASCSILCKHGCRSIVVIVCRELHCPPRSIGFHLSSLQAPHRMMTSPIVGTKVTWLDNPLELVGSGHFAIRSLNSAAEEFSSPTAAISPVHIYSYIELKKNDPAGYGLTPLYTFFWVYTFVLSLDRERLKVWVSFRTTEQEDIDLFVCWITEVRRR